MPCPLIVASVSTAASSKAASVLCLSIIASVSTVASFIAISVLCLLIVASVLTAMSFAVALSILALNSSIAASFLTSLFVDLDFRFLL